MESTQNVRPYHLGLPADIRRKIVSYLPNPLVMRVFWKAIALIEWINTSFERHKRHGGWGTPDQFDNLHLKHPEKFLLKHGRHIKALCSHNSEVSKVLFWASFCPQLQFFELKSTIYTLNKGIRSKNFGANITSLTLRNTWSIYECDFNSVFPKLRSIEFVAEIAMGVPPREIDSSAICHMPSELESIVLRGYISKWNAIEHCTRFHNLKELAIGFKIVANNDLDSLLQTFTRLKALSLNIQDYPRIDPQTITRFTNIQSLTSLDITHAYFMNNCFAVLSQLPHLIALSLKNCGITSSQFNPYAPRFTRLTNLNLNLNGIDNDSAPAICLLTRLQSLSIGSTLVNDEGFKMISQHLTGLTFLELQCNITEKTILNTIHRFPALEGILPYPYESEVLKKFLEKKGILT